MNQDSYTSIKEESPQSPHDSVQYGGFWIRLFAFILDGILLSVVSSLTNLAFRQPLTQPPPADLAALQTALLARIQSPAFLVAFILSALYSVLLVWRFGATVGKMALRLRVVDAKTLGPVSLWQAILREFIVKDVLYRLFFFFSWLGYLWIGWDPRKQGWHDKIARTVVIRAKAQEG